MATPGLAQNPSPKPKLLTQVRQVVRVKHYSKRTEKAYGGWVYRFIVFHNKRHPAEMGENEIREFLNYLAVKENVAASTQNQALCAIIFLYREVLHQTMGEIEGLLWAKKPKHLPTVYSRSEVKAILSHLKGVMWLMVSLLYGAGLRLNECLKLRVHPVR